MKESFDFAAGEVLLMDKPLDWTSFDVVKKVRGTVKVKKVGHAGTLDPLATGLLILCTGKKTKTIEQLQGMDKTYVGEMTIGKTTPSYDLETEFDQEFDISHLSEQDIYDTVEQFTGEISQIPPTHSAIKVEGTRVYKLARKGEYVELKPRLVTIKRFEITKIDLPKIEFEVECTKGTYIRSLAHDFGKALGIGAHLSGLRRTAIGDFKIEDAYNLEEFVSMIKSQREGIL